MSISPIFNIVELTLYKVDAGCDIAGTSTSLDHADTLVFVTNIPPRKLVTLEKILESKVLRKTRNKTYMQFYSDFMVRKHHMFYLK